MISVETIDVVCSNCAAWFQVTLWLKNRGSLFCPGCGCSPWYGGKVSPAQEALIRCGDKDREIAKLHRVNAGLRGALKSKKTRKR